jgi:hypothetical protein
MEFTVPNYSLVLRRFSVAAFRVMDAKYQKLTDDITKLGPTTVVPGIAHVMRSVAVFFAELADDAKKQNPAHTPFKNRAAEVRQKLRKPQPRLTSAG